MKGYKSNKYHIPLQKLPITVGKMAGAVLPERDALVGKRVVISPVLQALAKGFCNALLQAGNKRAAVDGFDLLVAMIDTNQHR